jgi:hypothetical protein
MSSSKRNRPAEDDVKRRRIRAKTRTLLRKAQDDDADDLANPSKPHWDQYYKSSNAIFDQVDKPREAACEGDVFVELANAAHKRVDRMKADFTMYDRIEFIDDLKEKFFDRNGDLDEDSGQFLWEKLGQSLSFVSCCVPRIQFMLGPVDIVARDKTPRKKRARVKGPTEMVRPDQVDTSNDQQKKENRQGKRIATMKSKLRKRSNDNQMAKDFFPLVINPDSFTQTVENLFDYSFLIKQGHASIQMENGVPLAQPEDENAAGNFKATQCVASFSMKDWQELCKVHDIQANEGEIETRCPEEDDQENDGESEEENDAGSSRSQQR